MCHSEMRRYTFCCDLRRGGDVTREIVASPEKGRRVQASRLVEKPGLKCHLANPRFLLGETGPMQDYNVIWIKGRSELNQATALV